MRKPCQRVPSTPDSCGRLKASRSPTPSVFAGRQFPAGSCAPSPRQRSLAGTAAARWRFKGIRPSRTLRFASRRRNVLGKQQTELSGCFPYRILTREHYQSSIQSARNVIIFLASGVAASPFRGFRVLTTSIPGFPATHSTQQRNRTSIESEEPIDGLVRFAHHSVIFPVYSFGGGFSACLQITKSSKC
jgi:hypothetical protein